MFRRWNEHISRYNHSRHADSDPLEIKSCLAKEGKSVANVFCGDFCDHMQYSSPPIFTRVKSIE
jgi:hypothetical protein